VITASDKHGVRCTSGGDEFVVVLPQLEARNQELAAIDVELVCQKLLQALLQEHL
jgi:GGDEF domain-containing protein